MIRIKEDWHRLTLELTATDEVSEADYFSEGFVPGKVADNLAIPGQSGFTRKSRLYFRQFPFDSAKASFKFCVILGHVAYSSHFTPGMQVIFRLLHILLQKLLALPQGALAIFQRSFKGPVLHLDTNRALVTGFVKGGTELTPVHVA